MPPDGNIEGDVLELYDVMRTTFAAREFTDAPVSDALVAKLLDNARFAPSGGNRQGWKVLVVPEHMAFAAMLPLGKPVREFAMLERWDGEPLEPA